VQEMKSVGVSHNGKHLPADVVVSSLELLDPQAFERLLECRATNRQLPAQSLG